jgi:hypothetical protein
MLNPKGWTMLFLMFSTLLDGSFNYNGNLCTARKKLLDQANKALYALCKKNKKLSHPD